MSKLFDMSGKVAWVVGGGGYLGGPICAELAALGAHVIVADVNSDAAACVCGPINAKGLAAETLLLDAQDESAVTEAANGIVDRCGSLDVMVNATFRYTNVPMEEMSLAQWRDGMSVNLDAAFILGREAGRIMVRQGHGSIIQFASMYGLVSPYPHLYDQKNPQIPAHYCTAKAGVLMLVRYQAVKWAPNNVRVNAIVPGPFPFPDTQRDNPEFVARISRQVPLGRIGQPHEIAGAAVYLASDAASYVTGTAVRIDGGWTSW